MKHWLLALPAAAVLAGCGTTVPAPGVVPASPGASASPSATWPATSACGHERWPVKTGTDADAAQVNLATVQDTTVADMNKIAAPASLPQDTRVAPAELTVYRIHATLTGYKMEADSDYHLILADGGKTMIAEIPYPGCVAGGPLLAGIETSRQAFDAHFGLAGDHGYGQPAAAAQAFTPVSVPVTVTGVGFFDFKHGQDGVADNAIELHPVQSVSFGS